MAEHQRGKLKIFLGYAAGVGKTFKMLEEAQLLRSRGIDVVIGYIESHGRADTIAKAEGLETIPRKKLEYRGTRFEEMDTGSILERRPQVCLVDELAHTNVPGSSRSKRWEDVETLRDAGIDVLTTVNVQHIESLNDQVWHVTGIRVRETIPDWIVRQADEVVMVDVTPRALLHRLERGVVYSREKARDALQNFFRESSLVALRELTMREAAHEVEHRAESREESVSMEDLLRSRQRKQHKILAVVTPDPKTAMVIRRAKRVSDFLGAECFAVTAQKSEDLRGLDAGERASIENHLNFARNLHIETRILGGSDAVSALLEFARRNGVTQIFVTRPRVRSFSALRPKELVQEIISRAKDMQIVIVSDREPAPRG